MATVKAEEVIADAEAEVQLQMESVEAKVEEGVVETESADSNAIDVGLHATEEVKQSGWHEALDFLGDDSDWKTITSSALSTPQMEQTKLEAWQDPTISDDI